MGLASYDRVNLKAFDCDTVLIELNPTQFVIETHKYNYFKVKLFYMTFLLESNSNFKF